MKKATYISPALRVTLITGAGLIAASPLSTSAPTDITGITNGGTAGADDEAGVKGYSVWDDDWRK